MKLKLIFAAVSLILVSTASHAGVVYRWVTIDNNALPVNIRAQIEIDNGAVQNGSFKLRLEPGKPAVGDQGFVSFRSNGALSILPGDPFVADIGYLDIDVAFVQNNFFLTGTIRASNFSDRVNFSSTRFPNPDPRVFTLFDTNGDGLIPCANQPTGACEGATGYFQQVPEPASVALFGLGLAGVLVARRRKRK